MLLAQYCIESLMYGLYDEIKLQCYNIVLSVLNLGWKMKNYQLSAAIAAVVAGLGTSTSVIAEGMIHHESHEHGHATLNAAQQGKEVEFAFNIPAMDVVGFEHQPKNKAQEEKIHELADYLKNADQVITLPAAANCEVEDVKVESALLEDDHHDHDKHDDHHDEHDHHEEHKDHHDHGHHDKHDDHHDEHKGHDDHGHEAHGDDEHSEFSLHYHFECENPEALSEVQFNLFSKLTTLEEIEVNWLGDKSSVKGELSPSKTVLSVQ